MKTGPKPAVAMILLRPTEPRGFEVLLVNRAETARIFGEGHCFPAATVQAEDSSKAMVMRCRGVAQDAARRMMGAHFKAAEALGFWVAASRALFEQTGVLLASSEPGQPSTEQAMRSSGPNGEHGMDFSRLLQSRDMFLDAGKLLNFSHWFVSTTSTMSFAMRFFLAVLPEDQRAIAPADARDTRWLRPDRGLELLNNGLLSMVFPAFASLRTLADFETVESVLREFQTHTRSSERWVLE
jgi:8-oxo-dGTP pyrophosphatase MutT (NUDIX family)